MDWLQMIKDVGFPITVTLYILIRLEGTVRLLTDKITSLDAFIRAKLGD